MKKIAVSILIFSFLYGFSACSNSPSNETTNEKATTNKNASINGGLAVYKAYCLACHGKNGNAKLAGAKDLTASTLSEAETKKIIEQGSSNKKMLAYGNILKASDLQAVTDYVMSLQK